jgi:ubiquitin thioesterase protein OTUB1
MDHVSMSALVEVLAKPIGFAIEVFYLDRSQGDQPKSYRIGPVNSAGLPLPNSPAIYLLYRP